MEDICNSSFRRRDTGTFLGVSAGRLVDVFHFLSAGAVSFARGLNDTPKIAALLLVATALNLQWGLVAVAVAMAAGGLLSWAITLPCAALLSALAYFALRPH